MDKLNTIRRKIIALLQKTIENGATEAEATTAMEFASRMMNEYGITLDDIKKSESQRESMFDTGSIKTGKQLHPVNLFVSSSIAAYTDTQVWVDRNTNELKFFGYTVDVELAKYIHDICKAAVDYEWNKYKVTIPANAGHKKRFRSIFMKNMALRLSQRLRDMKSKNVNSTTSGNELVVMKERTVSNAFASLNLKLKNSIITHVNISGNVAAAGREAANNVQFNRSINTDPVGDMKLIA